MRVLVLSIFVVFALVSCGSEDKATKPARSSLECSLMGVENLPVDRSCDSLYKDWWCDEQLRNWGQLISFGAAARTADDRAGLVIVKRTYRNLKSHCDRLNGAQ